MVSPGLPEDWSRSKVRRVFRGATFHVEFIKGRNEGLVVEVDGKQIEGNVIRDVKSGKTYSVKVNI